MIELLDGSVRDLLAIADQLAGDLASVPDNVDSSLPPVPVSPEAKREADEEYERIRREAERWEEAQKQPPMWERFKDTYKRTGENMIDSARKWIADDIRNVRQAEATERFWQDASKKAHEQYPHGHQKQE